MKSPSNSLSQASKFSLLDEDEDIAAFFTGSQECGPPSTQVSSGESSLNSRVASGPKLVIDTAAGTSASGSSVGAPFGPATGKLDFSKFTTVSTPVLGKRLPDGAGSKSEPPPKRPRLPSNTEDDPFLEADQGDPTKPCILANSPNLIAAFNSRNLPFGVRYEIARLMNAKLVAEDGVKMDSLDKLEKLGTNEKAAPRTCRIVLDPCGEEETEQDTKLFEQEKEATSPWAELDLEEAKLRENPEAGLGFVDDEGWFGGKVNFRASLHSSAGRLSVVLEKAEKGPSDRFSRRFGSTAFLRMKVHKTALRGKTDRLIRFLKRPFIIWDSVFRAFLASDNNVFLVRTNEVLEGSRISPSKTVPGRLSFLDFIEWHNPLDFNSEQTMTKWASRFNLGRSTSAPGLLLKECEILYMDDIVSSEGSDMTDGAGFINVTALRLLKNKFDWNDWPTAVQVRLAGAKGLLVQHPTDHSDTPKVWLRPSMIKINYPSLADPTHRIIDVLRSAHTATPCRLNYQTLINLFENGVAYKSMVDLLSSDLETLTEPFLSWDAPDAAERMWLACASLGGVFAARAARHQAWLARLSGYSERESDELEEDEDGFDQFDPKEDSSAAWWDDETSGQPSSLEETVMFALDAGFTPERSAPLREKIKNVVKPQIRRRVRSYRIGVPNSATAFLIPDPCGVLEDGEIFFKNSRRNLPGPDGTETDIVLGDILLTRNPCRLPTDIQKWVAVDQPELRDYTDVMVMSIKGFRRAADWLAGGDYDGDKGLLIFQPELVRAFQNASPQFANEPPDLKEKNFRKDNETVQAFRTRIPSVGSPDFIQGLQHYLLGSLRDTSVVGQYSTMQETAIYTLGYGHPETIRLGYMFNLILDGAKTGMKVLPEVFKEDKIKYEKGPMKWREPLTEGDATMKEDNRRPKRASGLGKFIMDILYDLGKERGDEFTKAIEDKFMKNPENRSLLFDSDLAAPWEDAQKRAARSQAERGSTELQKELELIQLHIVAMYTKHRTEIKKLNGKPGSPRKKAPRSPTKSTGAGFTDLPIETRQNTLRTLSKAFVAGPPSSEILTMSHIDLSRLRASYAYIYDYNQNKPYRIFTHFPWDVAFRELCTIKATVDGRQKTVMGSFYEKFGIRGTRK